MPNKQAIIENVDMYSADELVKYIKAGIVTFEELCDETEGYFSASVRKQVEKKLAGSEEDEWQIAKSSNSTEVLEHFLATYPLSVHRMEAQQLLESLECKVSRNEAESNWETIDKNSCDELRQFCERYPNDVHCKEAKRKINQLIREQYICIDIVSLKERIKEIETSKEINKNKLIYEKVVGYLDRGKISHVDFLKLIEADHNIFGAETLNRFIDEGVLAFDELGNLGIDNRFIQSLAKNKHPQDFALPNRKLEKINKLSTEVYFWGIPSSGKSCALGAILSVANNGHVAKTMMKDNDCLGYGYMNRLSSLFTVGDVSLVPGKTPTTATYEMGFDLEDEEGKVHPLTCMDLAGELMRCMYRSDAGENLSNEELETLDILTNALIDPKTRTQNKKIHFFVMEYGAEDREYDGLRQDVYLNGALQYIKRTGIFKDDTVAIYILITKVDKAHARSGQLGSILRNYISENYGGFYNGLVKICKDYEINNGIVEIIPFSLGQVCFQDYCLFDERPAANIVRKLLERTKGFKNDRIHRGLNFLKK